MKLESCNQKLAYILGDGSEMEDKSKQEVKRK